MNQDAKYRLETFPPARQFTVDMGQLALKKHRVYGLIEADVTEARQRLRDLKAHSPAAPGFTAWVLKCLAQAASEYPEVHGLRRGRSGRVIFQDVDISVMVERDLGEQKVPLPLVLRGVQEKSPTAIQSELQSAKDQTIEKDSAYVLGSSQASSRLLRLILLLPRGLRLLGWRIILSNPILMKKWMGTIILSTVGTGAAIRGWAIPVSIHPLAIILGSIASRPACLKDQIIPRDFLPITIMADHDVIDGMPIARFAARFTQLLESGVHL